MSIDTTSSRGTLAKEGEREGGREGGRDKDRSCDSVSITKDLQSAPLDQGTLEDLGDPVKEWMIHSSSTDAIVALTGGPSEPGGPTSPVRPGTPSCPIAPWAPGTPSRPWSVQILPCDSHVTLMCQGSCLLVDQLLLAIQGNPLLLEAPEVKSIAHFDNVTGNNELDGKLTRAPFAPISPTLPTGPCGFVRATHVSARMCRSVCVCVCTSTNGYSRRSNLTRRSSRSRWPLNNVLIIIRTVVVMILASQECQWDQ